MTKFSVCIITQNGGQRLNRCLASVAFADEIIVVDSGSTDDTAQIVAAAGGRFIAKPWTYWAKQKNFALSQASHDWVLSLDDDEWLPENAAPVIRAALTPYTDAYYLGRRTLFLGKWIRHSGWYPDHQIRLFKKSVTQFADVPVHEKVPEPALHAILPLDIWHESYTSLAQYNKKTAVYTSQQAEQQQAQRFLGIKLLIKPLYRFLQTYIWQAGFLDGGKGLLLALLRARYEWLVIIKIFRLRQHHQAADHRQR